MSQLLTDKLKSLPDRPGVYFHKDKTGQIIYVGKAAVLRNRVRQYFQQSRNRDAKTEALVSEIDDVDWMVVDSELDALFLEAEMIRRYMPRYNILLRDDKSMTYIRIDYDSNFPTVTTTRRPLDDGAKYFGPYLSSYGVNQALKLLRRVFPFAIKQTPGQKRATLHYHLGLDPGLEEGRTSLEDYRANLRKLISVIQGGRQTIAKDMEKEMKNLAKLSQFEEAAKIRNQLFALQRLSKQVIFSDKEFMEISKDHALNELVELLELVDFPKRIEGYDISHMQGTDVVASMVVFTNGVSNKGEYRKFKTKIDHNNDFYNMNETIKRRLSEKNRKSWGVPSLVLIDGGKGQLDAAIQARNNAGCLKIPFIGLAKREEQIVIHKTLSNVRLSLDYLHKMGGFYEETDDFLLVNIPHSANLVKLLQRIRDESHRFAVSYHSVLKGKRQTSSLLDEIPTIGPATRKKLLKAFGSVRGILMATDQEIASVVGDRKSVVLLKYLQSERQRLKK
ncbi:excinuclease ABC subunit UvrC [Candidatus Saccharibacteria bacterium]|nr:excinuclease ABC subunit UvrC [Candidatus Saccharibacteria bacterium]